MATDTSGQGPRRFKRILNTMQSGIQSGLNNVQSGMRMHVQGNSTFYTASIQQQQSSKYGWLKKLSNNVVKNWHRRWFTLKGDHLYYFATDDESRQPQGMVYLPGNKVVEHSFNANEADKFLFEILPGANVTSHETYHLAAASDDERKEWVQAIRRVMYAEKGGAIFGQTLEITMKYEQRKYNRKIPRIVEMCVEYLTSHGLDTEGIFRLPGRSSVIRQLKVMFDCGEHPNLEDTDADFNTVASLFKQYLRELPDPIIPAEHYESVMKAVIRDMPVDYDIGLEHFAAALHELPSYNYNLLQYLCRFLAEVDQKSDKNKMNATNLATVFSQCIIRPEDEDPALLMGTAGNRSQVVLILIREYSKIFKLEYNAEGASVMVDNLLDIGDNTSMNSFDAESMSYFSIPKSSSLDNDLLGLDLNADSSIEHLPEPLFPVNHKSNSLDSRKSLDGYDGSDQLSGSSRLDLHESGYNTATSSSPRKAVLEEWDEEEEGYDEEIDDIPLFGSVRTTRQQSCSDEHTVHIRQEIHHTEEKTTTYSNGQQIQTEESVTLYTKRPSSYSDSSASGVLDKRNSLGRKAPVPPPRPSKRPTPSNSSDNIAGEDSIDDDEDDSTIEALTNTDLTGFSLDELHSFINTLFTELKSQRAKVKDLTNKVTSMKQKHKEKINKMAEKLDQEKTATARAVDKIMKVQDQLQQYQLRYSRLSSAD